MSYKRKETYIVYSENTSMYQKVFSNFDDAKKELDKLKSKHSSWSFDIFKNVSMGQGDLFI